MNSNLTIENAYSGLDRIGLVINEETKFILPLFYLDNKKIAFNEILKSEKQKLKLIVKAWRKYQRKKDNHVDSKGNDESEFYSFDVAISLVEDFVNNGLYIEFEKNNVYRRDGKIDFAKTIKKCKPLLTEQGPVYLKYISQVKKINDEEIIRNIQILALNAISKEIGWLIGFNIQLPLEYSSATNAKKALIELNAAKGTSFNTRKLMLIDLLIKYIRNTNKENSSIATNIFAGTAHTFWESMVFKVFGNITKKEINKKFYVRHAYRSKSSKKIVRVMDPLMPDAIYKDNSNISVIDAKYYSNNNLPSNDDISKQFIYFLKAFKSFGGDYNYNNWFIIPTSEDTKVVDLEVIFDKDAEETEELIPIKILYANTEEVVRKYVCESTMFSEIY
jgi:hypothetical protein